MENEEVVTEDVVEQETSDSEVNPLEGILRAAALEADGEEYVEDEAVEEPVEDTDNSPTPESEFYTIEELTELGKSESLDKINTAKIPPELQAVYKSLNAMATRRQQSLAEKERELEARLKQQAPAQPASPVSLEQKLYSDPAGALQDIQARLEYTNRAIYEAQAKDDIFEVQKLMVDKDTLKDKYMAVQGVIQGANAEWESIYKAIPDFQEKAPKLKGFTAEVLGDNGFTEAELNWLTNPLITGKISSKIVRLVSNMYDLKTKYEGSLKNTKEKLVKAKPTPSLSPGSGDVVKPKTDVKSIREKALATHDDNDIAEYIAAITKRK